MRKRRCKMGVHGPEIRGYWKSQRNMWSPPSRPPPKFLPFNMKVQIVFQSPLFAALFFVKIRSNVNILILKTTGIQLTNLSPRNDVYLIFSKHYGKTVVLVKYGKSQQWLEAQHRTCLVFKYLTKFTIPILKTNFKQKPTEPRTFLL